MLSCRKPQDSKEKEKRKKEITNEQTNERTNERMNEKKKKITNSVLLNWRTLVIFLEGDKEKRENRRPLLIETRESKIIDLRCKHLKKMKRSEITEIAKCFKKEKLSAPLFRSKS